MPRTNWQRQAAVRAVPLIQGAACRGPCAYPDKTGSCLPPLVNPVRVFLTFTADLEEMARWLLSCRITTVAMESTGVCWIPLYDVLERHGITPCLVNARNMKNVPGRRTDWHQCQWIDHGQRSPFRLIQDKTGRASSPVVITLRRAAESRIPARRQCGSRKVSGTPPDRSCANGRAAYSAHAEVDDTDESADPSRTQ